MVAASLPNPLLSFSSVTAATSTAEDPPLVITSFPSPLLPRSPMTAATATATAEDPPLVITSFPSTLLPRSPMTAATATAEDPPLVITSLPNPLLPRSPTAAATATAEDQPLVITDKDAMRSWSRHQRYHGKTIALVPTMGYLHSGHLSLVAAARSHADLTVVSIYVNPAQFAPSEDLATYPSDLPADLRKLASAPGVAAVFCPSSLYDTGAGPRGDGKGVSCMEVGGEGHDTWVTVERLEKGLCGESRPVLFRGVATVVTKLFNIVEPDVAVFGKKDYQQWRVISRMVRDLDFSVRIIGSEIVREVNGLAMSSRNVRLSPKERENALSIYRSLSRAKFAAQNGNIACQELKDVAIQTITEAGGRIDYVEIVDQQTLKAVDNITSPVVMCIAVWFGNVRLIDNTEISI